jgi:dolichol-phosphate mannosyltransferase
MNKNPELSIVIPVRDEAAAIPVLFREIEQVIGSLNRACEVLFIDDHSIDGTVEIVQKLVPGAIGRVRCISLDYKQGKDWALERGFKEAQGSIIITLDGDGQNDPMDIPCMLEALKDNDMVCGIRINRRDPLFKRLTSAVANQVRVLITGDPVRDVGCALRVMRAGCAEYLYPTIPLLYGCAHYFFPTILKKQGSKVVQEGVNHRKRVNGRSKFKLCKGRVVNGLRACFFVRYTDKPGNF